MKYLIITIAMLVITSVAYAHLTEDDKWYIRDLQSQVRVCKAEKAELKDVVIFYANDNNYQESSLGFLILETIPGARAKGALNEH